MFFKTLLWGPKNSCIELLKILINNAAIAYKVNSTAPISEQAPVTCKTNYFDTKNFTLQMLENGGIQDGGRVLTCGSVVSRALETRGCNGHLWLAPLLQ